MFPNVRWLPSASIEQRAEHVPFYNHVWSKDDPFWNSHQPGSLWNCKCDLEETDAEPSGNKVSSSDIEKGKNLASMDGNPYRTGEIFSKGASYFKRTNSTELSRFILNLPIEESYITAADGVQFNILRNADNLPKELHVALDLRKAKFDAVRLLPEIHSKDKAQRAKYLPKNYKQKNDNKNPDAVMVKDGKAYVVDFKVLTSSKMLVREIGKSAEQAEYCVVKMDYENRQGTHSMQARIHKAIEQSPSIKGIIVLDKKGNVFYSTF